LVFPLPVKLRRSFSVPFIDNLFQELATVGRSRSSSFAGKSIKLHNAA